MTKKQFSEAKNIYFIGIGGIGISAIARMLLLHGKVVSGSDRSSSVVTDELIEAGAKVFIDQVQSHIPEDCDLVIYTVAIPQDNIEIVEAKKRNTKILTYPETLNIISKEKYTIAVSGTHGKTTTTAMLAKIFLDQDLDPTVIVGSLIKNADGSKSNFIAGKSKYLVVEADEYKKAFLNLQPQVLIITNIDEDHLDFYKDLVDIQNTFIELVKKIPPEGFLICKKNDPHLLPVIKNAECNVIDYTDVLINKPLKVPGEHNRENARAAIAASAAVGIPKLKSVHSLASYEGVWRRFELKGETQNGALVYDDYAHNPQKVRAALAGAKELYPNKKIIAVFQPHLYSRTKLLLPEFAKSFFDANLVLVAPIFPAREPFDPSINSDKLTQSLILNHVNALSFESFDAIVKYLKVLNPSNEHIIITIGAGEAYKVGEAVIAETTSL